jgi:hypothetical protein
MHWCSILLILGSNFILMHEVHAGLSADAYLFLYLELPHGLTPHDKVLKANGPYFECVLELLFLILYYLMCIFSGLVGGRARI